MPGNEEHWLNVGHGVNGLVLRCSVAARGPSVGSRLHHLHTEAPKRKRDACVYVSRFTEKLAINLRPVYGPRPVPLHLINSLPR